MRSPHLVRPRLALLLAAGLTTLVTPAGVAHAATATVPATGTPITITSTAAARPGVTYGSFQVTTPRGVTVGYLLTADLKKNKVSLDLLHPDAVAQRTVVSAMTNEQGAVAGVNGDFFNNSETHAGVTPTYSSSGPEIADGEELKFAVPTAQRFGPGLAPGTSTPGRVRRRRERQGARRHPEPGRRGAQREGHHRAGRPQPVRAPGRRRRPVHRRLGDRLPGPVHLRHRHQPQRPVQHPHLRGDRTRRRGDRGRPDARCGRDPGRHPGAGRPGGRRGRARRPRRR